jgi:hypothetical protein
MMLKQRNPARSGARSVSRAEPRQKSEMQTQVEKIMRKQNYVDRAKLSPARAFKSPMDVVEANDIKPAEKLAILKGWEADERALLRAEDEGMGGGEHAHLHKVQAALNHLEHGASRTRANQHAEARWA